MAIVLPRQGRTSQVEHVDDSDMTEFLACINYCGGQHSFKTELNQIHFREETVFQRRVGHMKQDIYFR